MSTPIVERRKVRCNMTKNLKRYLRWWPLSVTIYYGIVAYFPPATFNASIADQVYVWQAWAVFGFGVLSVLFPFKLSFKSAMAAFALSRYIAAIATTLYEHEVLQRQGIFWARFFLLNASLSLTLGWVAMYAITIPYMKELGHERIR